MRFLHAILPILSGLILCGQVSAQGTLSGTITDSSGNPIPYATVYIQELQHGTTANAMGNYEIRMADGTYTVFYQSLGYNQDFRQIAIAGTPVVRNVSLTVQYFQIPEVNVSSGNEDPAYAIMRKAIARAPYYLNAVEHYKAMVYLKGTAIIDKIPRLLTRAMKNDSDIDISIGEKYLYESHNEIEFNSPDKYIHRLIAIQSTFPSEGDQISPMNYIQASFYEPVIVDIAISPLAPNAFTYYRFTYEGASLQGQYVINKIKVSPKRKSQQVFSGTIYIIEDLWCIHSLDLENESIVGKIRVRQLHTPVQDNFWMPVSHSFDIDFSMLGIKGRATYGSSVKYSEIATTSPLSIAINTSDAAPKPDQVIEIQPTKASVEMEKLLSKEDLSNRDMVRLSKLIGKEAASDRTEQDRKDLEIKETTTYIIEEDAARKTIDFWNDIRPIPLADDEILKLKGIDSLKTTLKEVKTPEGEVTVTLSAGRSTPFTRIVSDVLTGKTWRADSNRISVTFGGLASSGNFSFNSVDGFSYDLNFRFTRRWKNGTSFSLYPEAGYAFSRESFYYTLNSTLNYRPNRNDYFWFRTGDRSSDFTNYGSVNSFVNSISSLFLKENILRLYQSKYISIGHRSEISNGLYLELSAKREGRDQLENTTQFSFLRRDLDYGVNIPENALLDPLANPGFLPGNHNHYEVNGELTIIPYQRYRIINGRKFPAGSNYPTLTANYTMGFNTTGEDYNTYSKISASASGRKDTGPMSELFWKIRTGVIITGDTLPFHDFFHFNSQPFPVLLNDYRDAFYLPSWYSLATDKWFAEGHLKYTNPYLLLKYLPGLSNTLMRENIHIRYLLTPYTRHYTEFGYSISEVFLLGEIGVFAGFEHFRFKNASVRLVLKFN